MSPVNAPRPDELLLLPEVAALTRATLSTVRTWIASGRLKSLRPGRRVLVRRSALDAFLLSAER